MKILKKLECSRCRKKIILGELCAECKREIKDNIKKWFRGEKK